MVRFICLGIETSCDETAASVVLNGRHILSNIVLSQEKLHKVYGGIVPEIACRAHIEGIIPVIEYALKKAKVSLNMLSAIAVTYTPGLVGALLIGLASAKSLALVLNKPLIGINHLEAHLYAYYLHQPTYRPRFPMIGLVASGGHTALFLIKNFLKYQSIGATLDDAAGEAFDKVAHILGLGYPGGPAIQQAALTGNPDAIKFPRGFQDHSSLDFSFSGLKTAVLYYAKGQNASKNSPLKPNLNISDIAASFQEAIVDTLTEKVFQAARKLGAKTILLGGGVVANQRLRSKMECHAQTENISLLIPPINLCTDNAAMIAGLAYHHWRQGKINNLYLDAIPS